MPVVGIGGLFFRARNPDVLSNWYREHLGVGAGCVATEGATPDEWSWQTEGGPVVFAPFEATSDYFPADKQFMLNLRVRDLDGLLGGAGSGGNPRHNRSRMERPSSRPVRPCPRSRRQRDRALGTARQTSNHVTRHSALSARVLTRCSPASDVLVPCRCCWPKTTARFGSPWYARSRSRGMTSVP